MRKPCRIRHSLASKALIMWHCKLVHAKGKPMRKLFLIICILAIAGSGLTAASMRKEPPARSPDEIWQRCNRAVVEVLVDGRHSGSGWFARADGLLVTASHLFDARTRPVEIVSPVYGRLGVELVAIDRGHDVAVLRAPARSGGYYALPLASKLPQIGEEIWQFGAPIFRNGILQRGVIARAETGFEYYGETIGYVEVLYISGMMQGGTSGGPWLNSRGEVVGVQSGIMSLDSKPVGISYLSPVSNVVNRLLQLSDAATPTAGLAVDHLWESTPDFIKKLPAGTMGLVVTRLHKNGPAEQAGLKKRDVLLAADGKSLIRIEDLLRVVAGKKPGNTIELTTLRSDPIQTNTIKLTLDCVEHPKPAPKTM